MQDSFYSIEELRSIGFKSIGKEVKISKYARFYDVDHIEIGNNVRIDDFCIFSGKIQLGSNIHISAYSALYGKHGITMEDYTGLSPRCTIFSASDDFSGNYLIGPMIDSKYTRVTGERVIIKKFSQLGSNCVVLPGVTVNQGVAVGAMSLISRDLDAWKIYKGIPAQYYENRSKKLLNLVNLLHP